MNETEAKSDAVIAAQDIDYLNTVISRDLFSGIRFGLRPQVVGILERFPALASNVDPQGHSAVHWAAKKGDVEILNLLFDKGASLSIADPSGGSK